jgi:hypothetical protein
VDLQEMKILLLLIALVASCGAQDLTAEALTTGLRTHPEVFESLPVGDGMKGIPFEIKLGDTVATVGKEVFDGFRFKVPDSVEGSDLVWYFNAPDSWGNWYILPVEGDAAQAFKSWLPADRFYRTYDQPKEKGRTRILQTLTASYFKKGAEYIMWFRKVGPEAGGQLRGVLTFAKSDKWDHGAIEKSLHLEPAPAEDQVAGINSRGGLILLDQRFFEHPYAAERIDTMFDNIRTTQKMQGGFFITMKTVTPPCSSHPSLTEITKAYGPPDFVRTAKEEADRTKTGNKEEDQEPEDVTTYYIDHFGFEVANGDKEMKVQRVLTQAEDFSVLAPPKEGSNFASVAMENLTVFHSGGKEVGRAYLFREEGEKPVFITTPPPGTYKGAKGTLIYKGDGNWTDESYFEGGKIAQRMPMANHRLEGTGEVFYPDGKKRFTAPYKNGVLNGDLVEYDPDGKEKSRRKFKDGEEQ